MEAPSAAHQGPGIEGAQVEGAIIQPALCLGVPGLQDLKPAVEEKALTLVGAHPAAAAVAGLQDQGGEAPLLQGQGTGQAGETGADYDDVYLHGGIPEQRMRLVRKVENRYFSDSCAYIFMIIN